MASNSTLITALEPVRPGDLITADFVNGIISAMLELEGRVSVLEAEGRMVVPEGGGEPVAQVVITAAVARKSDVSLAFEVYGSGLDPAGLKTFMLNNVPFDPENLRGDDSKITFIAERSRFGALGDLSNISDVLVREAATTRVAATQPSGASAAAVAGAAARFRANTITGALSSTPALSAAKASILAGVGDRLGQLVQPINTILTIEANSGSRATRAVQMLDA